jgi:hypothetical protein
MGGPWIPTWLEAVAEFSAENLDVNGALMVSAWGWFQNILGATSSATILAGVLVAATAVPFAYATAVRRWTEIPWYAAAPVILVAAPSALYYDATLTVVTVLAMLALMRGIHPLFVVAVIAVTWTQAFASSAGWSPLFIPVAAAAIGFAIAALRPPSPG